MKREPVIAYLLLGSNVGDRLTCLQRADAALSAKLEVVDRSRVYETAAWGDRRQRAYLNQVIAVRTDLAPADLHRFTRSVETAMGRTEKGNYRPRTIDIDLLFYGHETVRTDDLEIPHPKIRFRRFVLTPLCDIAPELVHPVFGQTAAEMLEACRDSLPVDFYRPENGEDGTGGNTDGCE